MCTANDPCCNLDCTLKAPAECSPFAGDCCDVSCQLTGFDNASVIPVDATPCREGSGCTLPGFCIKDIKFEGKCPDADFPHHQETTPDGCDIFNASDLTCERTLPENPAEPYEFHKPDGTLCNFDSNTCQFDGCTGSICALFNHTINGTEYVPTECILTNEHACELSCNWFNGSACVSSYDFAETTEGISLNVTGFNRAPGRSCNNFAGFCDQSGVCQVVSGESPFDVLLSLDVVSFVRDNWYTVAAVEVAIVLFAFILRATYRKRHNLKEQLAKKEKVRRKDIPQPHKRAGTMARKIGLPDKKLKELQYKKAKQERMKQDHKRYGMRRAEVLFPTAGFDVLRTVMASSPHEEALVLRMLTLGYPMDTSLTTLLTIEPPAKKPARPRGQQKVHRPQPQRAQPQQGARHNPPSHQNGRNVRF